MSNPATLSATIAGSGDVNYYGDPQISKSTVTRLVAQLEAQALVRRTEDETDARSTIVALAPRGHALLADMAEGSNDYLRQRLGALTDDERKRLADAVPILTRLAERE